MRAVAHTPRDGSTQWHDLSTHLHDTAHLAAHFATKFQAGELAYLAGLLHDLGKYNPDFQKYLFDAHAGRATVSTPHAVYGGLAARDEGLPALAFTVHGHHTQMPSPADLQNAFADPEITATYKVVLAAAQDGGWELNGHRVDPSIFRRDLDTEMLLRMVFSCLVDADYLDTEAHFDPDRAALRTPAEHRPAALLAALVADQERIMSGAAGARKPKGSATSYVENCSPSESRDHPPSRLRSSRVGVSPTPMLQAHRRAYSARRAASCAACGVVSSGSRERCLSYVQKSLSAGDVYIRNAEPQSVHADVRISIQCHNM